ncbi:MAG: amidase [Vicinamibacterales bacterium]
MRTLIAALLAALVAGCGTGSPAGDTPAPAALDVAELSLADAAARMADGALTSRALTEAYLQRIADLDDAGPGLNAVIDTNPNALDEADARDRERQAGQARGPLHGIPVLLKDNIDIAGMVNSAGSLALAEHRPARDAFLVERLRAAGAVILGKTNLSEWANFRSTRSTSGWSSRGGQTKNPYALDRNPCGSSSGTGSAIAASFAAAGVGTETDGSIICPSSVTGLVGVKPTVGLVSRSGIIPISISQDTAGPMARTVTDAAHLLSGMAGVDPADPAGSAADGRIAADYAAGLSADALAGTRVGLLRNAMGYHPDVDAAAERAAEAIRQAGGTVVDVRIDDYGAWDPPELEVLLYEFKDGLNRYLAQSGAPVRALADLIAWNRDNAAQAMPIFGQELFERAEAKGPLTDAAYVKARDSARQLALGALMNALSASSLDALLAPSMSPAWPTDHVLGDHFVGAGYGMAAVAGTPSITLPAGETHGLPLGVTLMGPAYSEQALLGYAYALEQRLKARIAPDFSATIE